jgi:U3 small nucleolar RNA-associated protein 7
MGKKKNQREKLSLKNAYKSTLQHEDMKKYTRGSLEMKNKRAKTLALKTSLEQTNQNIKEAVTEAVANEILLPSEAGYIELDNKNLKVYKLKQKEIIANVDLNTAKNAFDLQLHAFAPYCVNYTRNGRYFFPFQNL